MRRLLIIATLLWSSGCQLFGTNAIPPDGGPGDVDGSPLDAGPADAAPDAAPASDAMVFNGLLAIIGDRPEVTGSCDALTDYTEMTGHFTGATRMPVSAGWDFDTDADAYNDPSYGFQPNWASAPSERFSVRFTGKLSLASAGMHCFSIDIGATGTGIVTGKNACGQVYVNAGTGSGQATRRLIETGYQAESATANQACVMLPAGEQPFDIVFWYFNIFERARLRVRHCAGGTSMCTPDQPIAASAVRL
ncbi:MAG: hypothetical protein IT370_26995 [Deltaproteobacteria bacterium]|nr:hypothetical protein [Deltaproteobacteria bacterium]